jgi:aldehyde:ferredoxin oxidoreductase
MCTRQRRPFRAGCLAGVLASSVWSGRENRSVCCRHERLNRAYGRGGPGAVWGSKNLKAIRVCGQKKVGVKDRERYRSGLEQSFYLLKQAPATKRLLRELGTAGLVELINLINMLPHRNFLDIIHRDEDVERVSGETLAKKILQRAAGCYLCPMGCQRHTQVGDRKGEGPEYETMVMIGPDCGIYDLEAITRANYLCNELGMDTISFGGTLACAMELFERGLLTSKDTGGVDLRFGRSEVLDDMARSVAFRRGIGDRLAEGSFRLADSCGHPEFSMTIKKQEIPAYDPRASFTQALGYMTSPTGACHLQGAAMPFPWLFSAAPGRSRASACSSRPSGSGTCTTWGSSRTAWGSAVSPATPSPMTPGHG